MLGCEKWARGGECSREDGVVPMGAHGSVRYQCAAAATSCILRGCSSLECSWALLAHQAAAPAEASCSLGIWGTAFPNICSRTRTSQGQLSLCWLKWLCSPVSAGGENRAQGESVCSKMQWAGLHVFSDVVLQRKTLMWLTGRLPHAYHWIFPAGLQAHVSLASLHRLAQGKCQLQGEFPLQGSKWQFWQSMSAGCGSNPVPGAHGIVFPKELLVAHIFLPYCSLRLTALTEPDSSGKGLRMHSCALSCGSFSFPSTAF